MEIEKIKKLISAGENGNVELKSSFSDEVIKVAEIFRDTGLIERYGSGVKRAVEQIRDYGLPEPYIAESSGGFCFTILSKEFEEKTVEKTTQKTTQKILEVLENNPFISRSEIAEKLGDITEDGVKYNLAKLKEKGLIKRIGSDRGGHWEINPPNSIT